MPGHSLGNVENSFCRPALLRCLNLPGNSGAGYLMQPQNESVDQGNFQYLFGGTCMLAGSERGSELDNSAPDGDGDCLSPITGAEFLHNMFDVHFDSFF